MTLLPAGRRDAESVLLLAPGAGAPASSAWMTRVSELLGSEKIYVVRFDFPYMVQRLQTGSRRPPPKAEALQAAYTAAVDEVVRTLRPKRLVIGGKSLGGRVASLVAQALYDQERTAGLVCLGYPFHPPKAPDRLRTAHLRATTCPTLIVQGERDPFGTREEVESYPLSPAIAVHWARDGDHDLAPRRSAGATLEANLAEAAGTIARFIAGLPQTR